MPIKLKEWLKQVTLPLFKTAEEADLFLAASDLTAVEVTDEMQKAFNDKYLTRERAVTDEELLKTLNKNARGLILDLVDARIKKIVPLLSEDDQKIFAAETNTLNKLDLLSAAMGNLGKNDDVKKVSEAARKREAELHEKISGFEEQIKQKDANFDKEIKGVKLDYALRSMVAGFELAPEFSTDEHKNFLAESTIHSLKSNYKLEFDDKDERVIHLRKEVDGATVDVYEGNAKVSLTDVLKKKYEPYVKKSAGAEGKDKPQQNQSRKTELPSDRPVNGGTLKDRILAG